MLYYLYSCNNQWDNVCVLQAQAVCDGEQLPFCCGCTTPTNNNGCLVDSECEQGICSEDPFCCGLDTNLAGKWDQKCVNTAMDICQGDKALPGTLISTTQPIEQ